MKNKNEIKVFIVDDHPFVREGLRRSLETDEKIKFVGEAGNGNDAINGIVKTPCDIVLLDISMPDGPDGIQVMRHILHKKPALKVIFITIYQDDQYAVRLLRMGANGYIHKTAGSHDLLQAIHKVNRGGYYFSDNVMSCLIDKRSERVGPGMLSNREFQILSMLADKNTPSEIAKALCISPKTVSTHQAKIVKKLNLERNVDIIHYAIKHGLGNGGVT